MYLLRRDLGDVPILLDGEDEVHILDNFSTKACYEASEGRVEECAYINFLWRRDILSKVSFVLWEVFNNSLTTRDMLRHKGINTDSTVCVMCNQVDESMDHLFLHCQTTFKILDYFIKAFPISWPLPATILQLFEAWTWNVLSGRCKKIWSILHYAIVWNIWKEMNNRVFGGRHKSEFELLIYIKQTFVLWSCELDTFRFIDTSQILQNWECVMHM